MPLRAVPSPYKILGLFHLIGYMAYFGANSVVYFNRNVRPFTAMITTVSVYCWWLTGVLLLGRGLCPSLEKFGPFSLEMAYFEANSVVYFNRNVRLFTARTMTVTIYCWWLTGVLLLVLGRGCASCLENFGPFAFSLEMARFGANFVVYLTEMLGYGIYC